MKLNVKNTFIEATITESLRDVRRSASASPRLHQGTQSSENHQSLEEREVHHLKQEIQAERTAELLEKSSWELPIARIQYFARRSQQELDRLIAAVRPVRHTALLEPKPLPRVARHVAPENTASLAGLTELRRAGERSPKLELGQSKSEEILRNELPPIQPSPFVRQRLQPRQPWTPAPMVRRFEHLSESSCSDTLAEIESLSAGEQLDAFRRSVSRMGSELLMDFLQRFDQDKEFNQLYTRQSEIKKACAELHHDIDDCVAMDIQEVNLAQLTDTNARIEKKLKAIWKEVDSLSQEIHFENREALTELTLKSIKSHWEVIGKLNRTMAMKKGGASGQDRRRRKLLESQIEQLKKNDPIQGWKEKSKEGDLEADYILGRLFLNPFYEHPQDLKQASSHLLRAAGGGHFLAQKISWKMTTRLDPKGENFAEQLNKLLSNLESDLAFNAKALQAGQLLLEGVKLDDAKVIKALLKCSEDGNHIADQMLGKYQFNSAKVLRTLPFAGRSKAYAKMLEQAEKYLLNLSRLSWDAQQDLARISIERAEAGLDRSSSINQAAYWLLQGVGIGKYEGLELLGISLLELEEIEEALSVFDVATKFGFMDCHVMRAKVLSELSSSHEAVDALLPYFESLKALSKKSRSFDDAVKIAMELGKKAERSKLDKVQFRSLIKLMMEVHRCSKTGLIALSEGEEVRAILDKLIQEEKGLR